LNEAVLARLFTGMQTILRGPRPLFKEATKKIFTP
jgi:hypothetical protein